MCGDRQSHSVVIDKQRRAALELRESNGLTGGRRVLGFIQADLKAEGAALANRAIDPSGRPFVLRVV